MSTVVVTRRNKRYEVTVDGRNLPVHSKSSQGNVFYDSVARVYVKVGVRRVRRERAVWRRARKLGLSHHLAPLIDEGPNWNAFAEVKSKPGARRTSDRETIALLLGAVLKIWDIHNWNWTVDLDGEVVFLDYEM